VPAMTGLPKAMPGSAVMPGTISLTMLSV
jgi:hypothetical protein